MATMSHTKAQRKDWHAGKAKKGEGSNRAFLRSLRVGNYRGAATPSNPALYYRALN